MRFREHVQVRRVEDYLRHEPSLRRLERMQENAWALKANIDKRGSHVM